MLALYLLTGVIARKGAVTPPIVIDPDIGQTFEGWVERDRRLSAKLEKARAELRKKHKPQATEALKEVEAIATQAATTASPWLAGMLYTLGANAAQLLEQRNIKSEQLTAMIAEAKRIEREISDEEDVIALLLN